MILLHLLCAAHPRHHLVAATSNPRTALGASRLLHWHAALANGKLEGRVRPPVSQESCWQKGTVSYQMPVRALIPMARVRRNAHRTA